MSSPPTPTPTPTPTLAPEQIPPTAPAALTDVGPDGATKDEAIQVAEYFLVLYAYIWATNDLTAWNGLSDKECAFCSNVAAGVSTQDTEGKHSAGGAVTFSGVVVTVNSPGRLYLVEGVVAQEPTTVIGPEDDVLDEQAGATNTFHVAVMFVDGRWQIREVSF